MSFYIYQVKNDIQTRPPVAAELLNFKSHSPYSYWYFKSRPRVIKYFILPHLATMLLVRHVPYYYLCSFQKVASHGSYNEMLLTTNKRWNYFIILPPVVREDTVVALVIRSRAGVDAPVVIVIVVVVSSGVVNVLVRCNRRRCHRRCRQRCCPSQSSSLLSSFSSITPSPSTSSSLPSS